jgi:hypothetical protein
MSNFNYRIAENSGQNGQNVFAVRQRVGLANTSAERTVGPSYGSFGEAAAAASKLQVLHDNAFSNIRAAINTIPGGQSVSDLEIVSFLRKVELV